MTDRDIPPDRERTPRVDLVEVAVWITVGLLIAIAIAGVLTLGVAAWMPDPVDPP
jgi:hypothetical protein